MKFAVGYQLNEEGEESFANIVADYRDHVAEVYFAWGDLPSGRSAVNTRRGYTDWTAQQRMERDLLRMRELGVKLDLLFNANCYGERAISVQLRNQVGSVLDHLVELVGSVETVTTSSLFIARLIKDHYPTIEVRASVNMRLGQIQQMEDTAAYFDGYYVQRDYNRDLSRLRRLKDWADTHDKKLYLLANSGCLRCCAGQTFHDNLVAHDAAIDETHNVQGFEPHLCWNLVKSPANWKRLLQATWIRPEDLHHYDGLFPLVKLATRMHSHPRLVIDAYAQRRYRGNLLNLFEPSHARALAPQGIDNSRLPPDWFAVTSTCGGNCHTCSYCEQALAKALMPL
jgi:hypothetical protein